MSLIKRSVTLGGHATSVALETEFWAVLSGYAQATNQSLAGLVGTIDSARGTIPLASALRVFALAHATHSAASSDED
jgi:predicted DNA-binding ribbon-helix-helix protein